MTKKTYEFRDVKVGGAELRIGRLALHCHWK